MDPTALLALPYDLVASVWANLDVIGFFVVAWYSYRMFNSCLHYVSFVLFCSAMLRFFGMDSSIAIICKHGASATSKSERLRY